MVYTFFKTTNRLRHQSYFYICTTATLFKISLAGTILKKCKTNFFLTTFPSTHGCLVIHVHGHVSFVLFAHRYIYLKIKHYLWPICRTHECILRRRARFFIDPWLCRSLYLQGLATSVRIYRFGYLHYHLFASLDFTLYTSTYGVWTTFIANAPWRFESLVG